MKETSRVVCTLVLSHSLQGASHTACPATEPKLADGTRVVESVI